MILLSQVKNVKHYITLPYPHESSMKLLAFLGLTARNKLNINDDIATRIMNLMQILMLIPKM